MSSHHCHGEHSEHDHDHSDDLQPALQYSLYRHIIFNDIICLNESEPQSAQAVVKKTWAQRYESLPELKSDTDEQLLIHIPFTGQVKLHSIFVRTSNIGCAAQTLLIFTNRDDLDFSTASELTPTQVIKLPQSSEVQEIQVKRSLFGNTQSLTLFIQDNYGDDFTRIAYLGFKGDWMQLGRAPHTILYEATPNPSDHVIQGENISQMKSGLGDISPSSRKDL